jgi:hypothetical protein
LMICVLRGALQRVARDALLVGERDISASSQAAVALMVIEVFIFPSGIWSAGALPCRRVGRSARRPCRPRPWRADDRCRTVWVGRSRGDGGRSDLCEVVAVERSTRARSNACGIGAEDQGLSRSRPAPSLCSSYAPASRPPGCSPRDGAPGVLP